MNALMDDTFPKKKMEHGAMWPFFEWDINCYAVFFICVLYCFFNIGILSTCWYVLYIYSSMDIIWYYPTISNYWNMNNLDGNAMLKHDVISVPG